MSNPLPRIDAPVGSLDSPLDDLGNPLPSLSAGGGRRNVLHGIGGGGGRRNDLSGAIARISPSKLTKQRERGAPQIVVQRAPTPQKKRDAPADIAAAAAGAVRTQGERQEKREQARRRVSAIPGLSGKRTRYGAPVETPERIPKKGTAEETRASQMRSLRKRDARAYHAMPAALQSRVDLVRREQGAELFDDLDAARADLLEQKLEMLRRRPNKGIQNAIKRAQEDSPAAAERLLEAAMRRDREKQQAIEDAKGANAPYSPQQVSRDIPPPDPVKDAERRRQAAKGFEE